MMHPLRCGRPLDSPAGEMSAPLRPALSAGGFTLLEVMIALVIGTLIVGGVMGLISTSLQYRHRLQVKTQAQPVLEAAAEEILSHPELAQKDSLTLQNLPESPSVAIARFPVQLPQGSLGNQHRTLYKVLLSYETSRLEFSLVIPSSALQ